jgi:hypothetical protein
VRRFRKKSKFHMIVLPGIGRITDDRVIEGNQYAKHFSLLDEIPQPSEGTRPSLTPVAVERPSSVPVTDEAPASDLRKLNDRVTGTSTGDAFSLDDALSEAETASATTTKRRRSKRKAEV